MMKLLNSLAMTVSLCALAACAERVPAPADGEAPMPDEKGDCPVISSDEWRAWVNAMPGPGARATLIVEGDITLPTPGYFITMTAGMADRSAVPTQRINLTATPPQDMVAQVITTESVRYEGPAIAKTYRGVIVMCGEKILADIDDVITAE